MKALVLGAAVSGRSAAALLGETGWEVSIYDRDPDAVSGLDGYEVGSGEWDRELLSGVELVVTSPGVPEGAPPLRAAIEEGIPVWSELELGFRHIGDVPICAVTATNGKTTVTELAAAMLTASGKTTAAVGNIGDPLSGAVGGEWDVLVVEASSFQLRFVETFRASAAVILNVAPDHLDWHGSMERYAAAKARLLERQTDADVVVFDADDPGATAVAADAVSQRIPVSGLRLTVSGFGVAGGDLLMADAVVALADLPRSDPAMVVDIAAAGAAALHLGAAAGAVEKVARDYRPGRHRRETVATIGGVTFVNDSKATNPHAALAAIRSYSSVVLIAGGRAKGLDISPLALEPNLTHVVAIGEAAGALSGAPSVSHAGSMGEAVTQAMSHAAPGDVVLLAPGCASFDMFRSYGDRGNAFTDAVRSIGEAS